MSHQSSSWSSQQSTVPDPLKGYQRVPIISGGGPNSKYLGRVIIELWQEDGASDDSKMIAISADAVDGKHAQLLPRIAAALAQRMTRGNPLDHPA
jgi:hypothetical protein